MGDKILTRNELLEIQSMYEYQHPEIRLREGKEVIATALSLYAAQEALNKRVGGLIEKWEDWEKHFREQKEICDAVGGRNDNLPYEIDLCERILADLQGLAKEGG
jgi:hypothetical protein